MTMRCKTQFKTAPLLVMTTPLRYTMWTTRLQARTPPAQGVPDAELPKLASTTPLPDIDASTLSQVYSFKYFLDDKFRAKVICKQKPLLLPLITRLTTLYPPPTGHTAPATEGIRGVFNYGFPGEWSINKSAVTRAANQVLALLPAPQDHEIQNELRRDAFGVQQPIPSINADIVDADKALDSLESGKRRWVGSQIPESLQRGTKRTKLDAESIEQFKNAVSEGRAAPVRSSDGVVDQDVGKISPGLNPTTSDVSIEIGGNRMEDTVVHANSSNAQTKSPTPDDSRVGSTFDANDSSAGYLSQNVELQDDTTAETVIDHTGVAMGDTVDQSDNNKRFVKLGAKKPGEGDVPLSARHPFILDDLASIQRIPDHTTGDVLIAALLDWGQIHGQDWVRYWGWRLELHTMGEIRAGFRQLRAKREREREREREEGD